MNTLILNWNKFRLKLHQTTLPDPPKPSAHLARYKTIGLPCPKPNHLPTLVDPKPSAFLAVALPWSCCRLAITLPSSSCCGVAVPLAVDLPSRLRRRLAGLAVTSPTVVDQRSTAIVSLNRTSSSAARFGWCLNTKFSNCLIHLNN